MEAVQEFPNGFFFIRCKAQPYSMDVNGGSMINDSTIIIWPQKMIDSINQLWMHEEGFLINKKSGLVLDIRGGRIEKDNVIIQYARKPGLANNQRWTYSNGFIHPTTAPHLVLDIKGGDYRNGNTIYLNAKNIHSASQQWIIQPFKNEKSDAELALLRPSVNLRNCSFPRQDELYDCYRLVYLSQTAIRNPEQLAAAGAFKGMKEYIDQDKVNHIIANDETRHHVLEYVQREVIKILNQNQIHADYNELTRQAMNVAEAYFSREYSVN